MNGMDLMELFPKPPSMIDAKTRQKEQLEEIRDRYSGRGRKTEPDVEEDGEKKN